MTISGINSKNLSVTKQKNLILNNLNFNVRKGSLTGLIGPSGSGKTTLMRVMVGIQIPSSGSLTVGGVKSGDKSLRKSIGYVTQNPSIYEDLTVQQNLRYFASLIGADHEHVSRVLDQVELTSQSKQLASTLSGGQRARVSLAIALLGEPDVIILDEPTVGLDPVLRQKLWRLFRSFSEQGKTIVISSHVMDEAERCDDLLLLRDGELLWHESKDALLSKTKTKSVEDAFLKLIGGMS